MSTERKPFVFMNSFRLFPHLDLAGRVSQLRFFDQVITPAVEPENSHLIAPFNHISALLARKKVDVLWHELLPYYRPDVFSSPLQLFHKLLYQCFGVWITNMRGLALEGVTNAHKNWNVNVFLRQRICGFFSLRFVVIRLRSHRK